MTQVLIIEDDPTICKLLSSDLRLEGYAVTTKNDGEEGLISAESLKPDLIILDISLPGMSGYDVCRSLRRSGSNVPIIMLTARGQETEKAVGLDLGADDYISKPYGSLELMARVRAVLRRHRQEVDHSQRTAFGDIVIDFRRMAATKAGKPLSLTTKEYQMLELLLRRPGQIISRDQFLKEVWGFEDMPSTRTVDNRVMTLRRKLCPENPERYIISIHGTGYKFVG